ncbi:hypothetical protein RQP46_008474 [Phenoliferia psychrophenolica]
MDALVSRPNTVLPRQRALQADPRAVYLKTPRAKLYMGLYLTLWTVGLTGSLFGSYKMVRAKNALFPHATTPPPAAAAASVEELSPVAESLVAELRSQHADPHRVWTLFSQLDYENSTHTLSHGTLHAIIPALQPPRVQTLDGTKKGAPLSLARATIRAQDYTTKVDRVRARIVENGGKVSATDLAHILRTYYLLGYAPGAIKVWDELIIENWAIVTSPTTVGHALGALRRWVDLHQNLGGMELAKVAALPLVDRVIAMGHEITADLSSYPVSRRGANKDPVVAAHEKRRTLELFAPELFNLLTKAQDIPAFKNAMKLYYGFDMDLPGAAVDAPAANVARRRELGEDQIRWIFELYTAEATPQALSSMIAIFEVCDNPSPVPDAEPAFFGASFPPPHAVNPDRPPIVGTFALSSIVRLAGKLDMRGVVRHYFNLLYFRWAVSADRKIRALEELVGIEWQGKGSVPGLDASADAGDDASVIPTPGQAIATAALEASPSTGATPSATAADVPLQRLGTPVVDVSFFARGDQAQRRDYRISSRFVADTVLQAKRNGDAPTAHLLRRRANWILRLSEQHTTRLAAILDRLEPADPSQAAGLDAAEATPPTSVAVKTSPSERRSLEALTNEMMATLFHQVQLRLIHPRIKADLNVVHQRSLLRPLIAQLHAKLRQLQRINKQGNAQALATRVAVRRKENKILRQRMMTARTYIMRLQVKGKATPTSREYVEHLANWRSANEELIRKGASEDAVELDDGWTPDDAAAGKASLEKAAA